MYQKVHMEFRRKNNLKLIKTPNLPFFSQKKKNCFKKEKNEFWFSVIKIGRFTRTFEAYFLTKVNEI